MLYSVKAFLSLATWTTAVLGINQFRTDSNPGSQMSALRYEAARSGVLIGSGAINASYLEEPQFAATLAKQFKSLSPENDMKWVFLNPTEGVYDWSKIDRLVEFAGHNDMVVKGHGLISSCCSPHYLLNMTDAAELLATMTTHFEAVMHRYRGKVDRWDVVTEALATKGGGLQNNTFHSLLGPGYIDDAFRIAHAADPEARLFINDNLVEYLPGKRQELYDLISGLVSRGVPLNGVALQMHITEVAPQPGVLTEIVNTYKALGLEVSIAEMDVHTLDAKLQAEIYGAVVGEALEAGIKDISFWGFTDKHLYTWLPGAKPLMFDEEYRPKGAFYATHAALARYAKQAPCVD